MYIISKLLTKLDYLSYQYTQNKGGKVAHIIIMNIFFVWQQQ